MATHDERREIVQRCILDPLKRVCENADGATGRAAEIGRLVIERLPVDYDAAALEAVCGETGKAVLRAHQSSRWPMPAKVYQALCDVLAKRTMQGIKDGMERQRREAFGGHWDDWTVENSRSAIAKVEAELARTDITPQHRAVCQALLRMAKAAEQRCLEREI